MNQEDRDIVLRFMTIDAMGLGELIYLRKKYEKEIIDLGQNRDDLKEDRTDIKLVYTEYIEKYEDKIVQVDEMIEQHFVSINKTLNLEDTMAQIELLDEMPFYIWMSKETQKRLIIWISNFSLIAMFLLLALIIVTVVGNFLVTKVL